MRIRCKRCKKVKGKTSFSRDTTRQNGFFPWCMDCQNAYAKSHRFQDENAPPNGRICPVDDRVVRGPKNRLFCSSSCKEKAAGLKRKFGLTVEQYRAMVDATGGRCPICRNKPTAWHVDHDHSTGLVMGVVCAPCNVGALANTYHDPDFVKSLYNFLTNSPAAQLGIVARAPDGQIGPSKLHQRWSYNQNGDSKKKVAGGVINLDAFR
jgi:hypothetical protein